LFYQSSQNGQQYGFSIDPFGSPSAYDYKPSGLFRYKSGTRVEKNIQYSFTEFVMELYFR
jgi:hypothetical protein